MEVYDRKEPHTFNAAFWSDKDKTIPMVPRSQEYPQFTLTGPNGDVIWSGAMQQTMLPGIWEVTWTPEQNLPISDSYRMEYLMVTDDGRQISKSESFGLKDIEVGIENRDQRIVAFFGQPVVVQLAFDKKQEQVQVTALDSSDNPLEGPIIAEESEDNGTFYYRAQLSGGLYPMDSTNVLLWTIQESSHSIPTFVYQILDTIGTSTVLQINSVRMLVDKFQKAHDSYQGIKDVEIIEALKRGAEIINSYPPYTNWPGTFFYTYGPLLGIHQATSAWWLLNSQYMLEVDLNFQFTGQSVSLTYDRTSGIADELARLWSFIETMLRGKVGILRKMNGVGHLSTRPQTWRRLTCGMLMSRGQGPLAGVSKSNQALLISLFAGNM